eukprot:gb/GEZN01001349.1/.p1 GENE.gb/GEZN01001349.1/~~gb/GEZN01001349.1/.p1  ORF type:complete len:864 (-),score=80.80 gb/GEZN01001349.1/:463-3054(-)
MSVVVALWDFEAQNEQEISFKQGEQIQIISSEGDGWWEGVNEAGQRGLFPSNYVEAVPQELATVHLTPVGNAKKLGFFSGARTSSTSAVIESSGGRSSISIVDGTAVTTHDKGRNVTTMARYADEAEEIQEGEKKAARPRRPVNSDTRYGLWARNQGVYAGGGIMLCGLMLILWCIIKPNIYGWKAGMIGFYTCVAGWCIYYFEIRAGSNLQPSRIPYRSLAYLLCSMPMWVTLPTRFGAAACIVTAVTYGVSYYLGEEFHLQGADHTRTKSGGGKVFLDLYSKLVEEDRIGIVVWMSLYIIANIVQFFYNLHLWYTVKGVDLGPWIAWAKAFGSCINLNVAMLLLPVCRTPIRYVLDVSTANQSSFSRSVRCFVKYIVPLDNAIEFHIVVAYVVLVCSIGHTVFHLLNFVSNRDFTWQRFGLAPWITGCVLFFCILVMYSATKRNVKSTHFELFWYSHQLFVVFFVSCLLHGTNWLGPNFWKYFIVPGILYCCERMYREYYSSLPMPLMSATFMKPSVFRLELAATGPLRNYKEGQYAYINCPVVSRTEWHPFTISSAPQDKTVTFHIRVQAEGSWTWQVQDMLKSLSKKDAAMAEFATRTVDKDGKTEVRLGKLFDPLGRKFFRIYGPHAAPTQHLSEYNTAMVIGSGIGITPLHASLKSVVYYRWKFFVGKSYPDKVFFHWVFSYKEMSSFRWFFRAVSEASDAVSAFEKQGTSMANKRFEIHIHMTSAPEDCDQSKPYQMEKPTAQMTPEEDVAFWGQRQTESTGLAAVESSVKEDDLYCWLMNPPTKEQKFGPYITLHGGRPDWPAAFHHVNEAHHEGGDVGVLFCGNPMIADDLKENCQVFSNSRQGRIFRFHKENF